MQDEADALLRALQDPCADWAYGQYLWLRGLFGPSRRPVLVPAARHVLRNLHRLTPLDAGNFTTVASAGIAPFCLTFGLVDEFRSLLHFTAAQRLCLRLVEWPNAMPVQMLRLACGYPHVTGCDAAMGSARRCGVPSAAMPPSCGPSWRSCLARRAGIHSCSSRCRLATWIACSRC